MTFEELIKIIVETVTKYFFLERQKVAALCFDEVNKTALMEAAQSINGRADYFSGSDIERIAGTYDVMFVDYIRFPDAAEAALGLAFSPWGRLMGNMLAQGKPVFQLKKTPGSRELSPAYRAMLKGYWKQLYALGVRLLDADGTSGAVTTEAAQTEAVYTGNVLSRKDLFAYANGGRLVLGKDVVVTDLAADTAKLMNIDIIRLK